MADLVAAPAKLDIGEVVRVTFGVIQRNLASFLILSTIFAGVPSLVVGFGRFSIDGGQQTGPTGAFLTLFASLVSIATNAVLQGALIHLTAGDLNGRKGSVADGLATGLRNFLPLVGLGILYGVGVGLGMLLLIVPGFILLVMWSVAGPALIVERKGVTESFTRSGVLTKGSRWTIFGLIVIYFVVAVVIQMALTALVGGLSAFTEGGPGAVLATTVISILTSMIGAAGGAVLYPELRRIRDGVGVSELAAIFD